MKTASLRTLAVTTMAMLVLGCASSEAEAPDEPSPEAGGDPAPEGESPEHGLTGSDLDGDLPPVDPLALEPLYGEALADLGVKLTERGGLIDRVDGYEVSPEGTHLALYVAPISGRTDDEYVDGIVELARVFLDDVFDRWPGLQSFDVCQERPEDEVESGYVATVSQIDVYREASEDLDWSSVELADLFAADREMDDFSLRVFGDLQHHETIVGARRSGDGW